jgi:hypothetical protein
VEDTWKSEVMSSHVMSCHTVPQELSNGHRLEVGRGGQQRSAGWTRSQRGLDMLISRMSVLLNVYHGTLPGDLDDMVQRRQRHPDIYKTHPVLMLASSALKYGPARDAFEVVVRRLVPAVRPRTPLAMLTSRGLYDVLSQTAVALRGVDMATWVQNCGQGVARHSGFLPWLQRQGVLVKCGPATPPARGLRRSASLELGQQGLAYQAATFSASVAARMDAMLRTSLAIQTCQLRPCSPLLFECMLFLRLCFLSACCVCVLVQCGR